MSDLVKRLRDLAQAKHDDLSIGDEAAARIAEWERLLGLADSWITAAIECAEWRWDADQHDAATRTRDEIRAALEGRRDDPAT